MTRRARTGLATRVLRRRITTSRVLLALLAALPLAGCAAARQQTVLEQQQKQIELKRAAYKAANEQARLGTEECKAQFEHGEIKTWVGREKCVNAAVETAYKAADYPFMDLVLLLNAERLVLGEKADRGELTEGQVLFQLADFFSTKIRPEMERRIQAAQEVLRQNAMADAAISQRQQQEQQRASMALMAAGFGMMASPSPYPGVAIGQGSLIGIQNYEGGR